MITSLTKSKSLEFLRTNLKTAQVLDLFYFTSSDWRINQSDVLKKIHDKWPPHTYIDSGLIVRSSAQGEDSNHDSKAGRYESVLGVRMHGKQVA